MCRKTRIQIEESKYMLYKDSREYIKEGVPIADMAVLYRTGERCTGAGRDIYSEYQIPYTMRRRGFRIFMNILSAQDINSYFQLAVGEL